MAMLQHLDGELWRFPDFNDGNRIISSSVRRIQSASVNKGIGIKLVLDGMEHYNIDHKLYDVHANSFLVVNHGSEVICDFDYKSVKNAEGVCYYLEESLISEAYQSLTMNEQQLLDQPMEDYSMRFIDSIFPLFNNPLNGIFKPMGHPSKWTKEEVSDHLFDIAKALIVHERKARGERKALPAARSTTQKELYRRLVVAKTYLHDNLSEPLDMKTVARVACLSEYHFIRSFRLCFGSSPHQYLLHLRMTRAKALLLEGKCSIAEVAQRCGYADPKYFSKSYKRLFGQNPSAVRASFG